MYSKESERVILRNMRVTKGMGRMNFEGTGGNRGTIIYLTPSRLRLSDAPLFSFFLTAVRSHPGKMGLADYIQSAESGGTR